MKKKKRKFEFGGCMLIIAFLLTVAVVTCSCKSADQNWYSSKKTASGRHDYYTPGWGYTNTCKTYNKLPTHRKSYNNLKYWRK